MTKKEKLEKLHEEIKNHPCILRKTCIQIVPGAGDVSAKIMFIGEAPGKVEDETGKPFVGPAGKFLDELLSSIGLERKDVYITNMVKCRPPNNRDPLPKEIKCCKPWLDKQIKLINPQVIVPLGRFAMAKFLPGLKISQAHGSVYKKNGKIYFVMYHPAVALYNGSMRQVLLSDMKKLKMVLDGELELKKWGQKLQDLDKMRNNSTVTIKNVKNQKNDKVRQSYMDL